MARVEGIEQRACLDSTHFAENNPVRSPAESGLQKVVERDVGLERVGLAFDRQNVRLLDVKLGVSSMTTMRSCSGMKSANIRKSVVLPVPVPPLISNVLALRICSAKKSSRSG